MAFDTYWPRFDIWTADGREESMPIPDRFRGKERWLTPEVELEVWTMALSIWPDPAKVWIISVDNGDGEVWGRDIPITDEARAAALASIRVIKP